MTALLSTEQIDDALRGLPEWSRSGDALVRQAQLPTFPDAITAVDRIAVIAEREQHHPDIDIRYRNLTLSCSTHSEGGITAKDTAMAGEIDNVLDGMNG